MASYNARYGYDGELEIGDMVNTEPGNMASLANSIKYYINSIDDSFEDFEKDSDRVWIIPIVDSLDVNGRTEVEIVGFAQFFVETIEKKSGKIEVEGRFFEYVVNGEIDFDLIGTGAYGIKLME